jgi:hypothetical protein
MYDRIFYELWTFSDFDRLCKLEKRGDEILKKSPPRKLLSQYQPNWHNFERDPPRDHPCQVWFNLVRRFQRRRFKCDLFIKICLICIIGINRLKEKFHKSSPLKPPNQIKPNLAGMVPGWVPFKIVSDSPALHSRWPLLLKIEISSNGQHCSKFHRKTRNIY